MYKMMSFIFNRKNNNNNLFFDYEKFIDDEYNNIKTKKNKMYNS
jgi:hypothetical protein